MLALTRNATCFRGRYDAAGRVRRAMRMTLAHSREAGISILKKGEPL